MFGCCLSLPERGPGGGRRCRRSQSSRWECKNEKRAEESREEVGSVLRWQQLCNNTVDFYVCRWEEITIWFMNGENQSDIGTVVLRMWTVCLI